MAMGPDSDSASTASIRRETLTSRALRTTAADNRIRELEAELNSAHEELVHRETQIRSLENSLNLNVIENLRLSGRIAESSITINQALSRLERMRQALLAAEAERDEDTLSHRAEICTLKAQLDSMSARAVRAEKQLADAQQHLVTCIAENNDAKCKISNAENAFQEKENQIRELKLSHAELIDQIKTRDAALESAEERIGLLAERVVQLEAKANYSKSQRTIAKANSSVQHEPVERRLPEAVASNRTTNSAVLKRDLDKESWLFGFDAKLGACG